MRSSSSSSALTRMTSQKRRIARSVWRCFCSHASIERFSPEPSPVERSAGRPPLRAMASMACAMARLSAQPSNGKNANDGARCKRRRQRHGCNRAALPIGRGKDQPVKKSNLIGGADAAIEIVEIRAAAQRDVLAIVDVLAAGQHVGRGAAAQEGAAVRANARGSRLQPARRPRKVPPGRRRSRSRSSRTSASRPPAQSRAQQNPGFFGSAQAHACGENIILALFDAAQQAAVNSRQRPERGAAILMHERNQADALARRNSTRARPQIRSRLAHCRRERRRARAPRRAAELREIFERQIDAAHFVDRRATSRRMLVS